MLLLIEQEMIMEDTYGRKEDHVPLIVHLLFCFCVLFFWGHALHQGWASR